MISAPVQHIEVGYGDEAILTIIRNMRDMIDASLGNQRIRQKAEELVSNTQQMDQENEARNIYEFVRDKVRYTKDPKGLEYIQTPTHMLEVLEKRGKIWGDCDDKTVLGLSLLKNLGFDVAIKVASYNGNKKFTHVYGLVKIDGLWVPFDATRNDTWLGWEAPNITRSHELRVGPDERLGYVGQVNFDWKVIFQNAVGITVGVVAANFLMKKSFCR